MVDLTNIGTLFAFILVCVGIIDPARQGPGPAAAVPRARSGPYVVPVLGVVSLHGPDLLPAAVVVDALLPVAAGRAVVYFFYGYRHSRLRQRSALAARAARRSGG